VNKIQYGNSTRIPLVHMKQVETRKVQVIIFVKDSVRGNV